MSKGVVTHPTKILRLANMVVRAEIVDAVRILCAIPIPSHCCGIERFAEMYAQTVTAGSQLLPYWSMLSSCSRASQHAWPNFATMHACDTKAQLFTHAPDFR